MPPIHFDDLAVGERLRIGEWTIDREECVGFARSWEPQPHHLSEEAGGASPFGRMTVPSLYLFAICTRLFFDFERPFAVLAMLGKDALELPKPAYPGDRLVYETECTGSRASQSRPDRGIVTLHDTLTAEDGRLVLRQDVKLLLARRDGA